MAGGRPAGDQGVTPPEEEEGGDVQLVSPHHVSYLVLFQSVGESLKGGCVEQGRVDEQRLHGIACSRVVTLGIHHCT